MLNFVRDLHTSLLFSILHINVGLWFVPMTVIVFAPILLLKHFVLKCKTYYNYNVNVSLVIKRK